MERVLLLLAALVSACLGWPSGANYAPKQPNQPQPPPPTFPVPSPPFNPVPPPQLPPFNPVPPPQRPPFNPAPPPRHPPTFPAPPPQLPPFNPAPPPPFPPSQPVPPPPTHQPTPPPPPPPTTTTPLPPQPNGEDCVYGAWTEWSVCSAACGRMGFFSRTRLILAQATGGGEACDFQKLEEWGECRGKECDQPCQMEPWGQWSECSASCDGGRRARIRAALTQPSQGGLVCGPGQEWEACNPEPCNPNHPITTTTPGPVTIPEPPCPNGNCAPRDCKLAAWVDWSECSKSCDGGRRIRTREVLVQAAFGGQSCGLVEQHEACNNQPCNSDCVLSFWTAWTGCPACGQGTRNRHRSVLVQATGSGQRCSLEDLRETEECPFHECPTICDKTNQADCDVDCVMNAWTEWGKCTASCGNGDRVRFRDIQIFPEFKGRPCGLIFERELCNTQPCQPPPQVTPPPPPPPTQITTTQPTPTLPTITTTTQPPIIFPTTTPFVPTPECELGEWAEWSPCSKTCGEGAERIRRRAAISGANCDAALLFQAVPCPLRPCDCEMHPWGGWTECSASCGSGRRGRIRSVAAEPSFGGLACGPRDEWEACNETPCQPTCELSEWTAWSACSAQCGQGTQRRTRQALVGDCAGETLLDEAPCTGNDCSPICQGFNPNMPSFTAEGCSQEFFLCHLHQAHSKFCPMGFYFDVISTACAQPIDVPACKSQARDLAAKFFGANSLINLAPNNN